MRCKSHVDELAFMNVLKADSKGGELQNLAIQHSCKMVNLHHANTVTVAHSVITHMDHHNHPSAQFCLTSVGSTSVFSPDLPCGIQMPRKSVF